MEYFKTSFKKAVLAPDLQKIVLKKTATFNPKISG